MNLFEKIDDFFKKSSVDFLITFTFLLGIIVGFLWEIVKPKIHQIILISLFEGFVFAFLTFTWGCIGMIFAIRGEIKQPFITIKGPLARALGILITGFLWFCSIYILFHTFIVYNGFGG